MRPRGLKPGLAVRLYAALEAPLFHVTARVHVAASPAFTALPALATLLTASTSFRRLLGTPAK
jgi:hypothetical protein